MLPILVCEGACNRGTVQAFDALLKKYGKSSTIESLDLVRSFRYQPHMHSPAQKANIFECVTCGAERKWGGEPL